MNRVIDSAIRVYGPRPSVSRQCSTCAEDAPEVLDVCLGETVLTTLCPRCTGYLRTRLQWEHGVTVIQGAPPCPMCGSGPRTTNTGVKCPNGCLYVPDLETWNAIVIGRSVDADRYERALHWIVDKSQNIGDADACARAALRGEDYPTPGQA